MICRDRGESEDVVVNHNQVRIDSIDDVERARNWSRWLELIILLIKMSSF